MLSRAGGLERDATRRREICARLGQQCQRRAAGAIRYFGNVAFSE
jgi:hypothetical protein